MSATYFNLSFSLQNTLKSIISHCIIIFLFLFCITFNLIAQPENLEIPDTIAGNLKKIEDPAERIIYLQKCALFFEDKDQDLSIMLASRALNLAVKFGDQLAAAKSYDLMGINYENKGQYIRAIEFYKKALDKKELLYKTDSNNKKIINAYSVTCLNLGNAFFQQGLNSIALEYYFKSMYLSKRSNDSILLAKIYNNIGSVYDNLQDTAMTFMYHMMSLKIKQKLNDKIALASSYVNIGNYYDVRNMPESTLYFYEMALKIKKETNDLKGQALVLNNISDHYLKIKNYPKAIEYGLNSLHLTEKINAPFQKASSLFNLGKIYSHTGKTELAYNYLQKAFEINKKLQSYELMAEITGELYNICKQRKDYKNALYYYELNKTAIDSLNNIQQAKTLARLEMKLYYENQAISKQNEFDRKESGYRDQIEWQKRKILFIIILLVISLILTYFIYRSYLLRKRDNNILKIRNAEITRQKEELKIISEKAMIANRQMIESEKKYKRLVEGISDQYFFYASDRLGKYTYASPSVFSILGYKPAEFCDCFDNIIVHDDRYRKMLLSMQYSWRGLQQKPYEIEVKASNGTFKIIEILDVPVIDEEGFVAAVESIAQNITERRHAEDALRKSEEQLSAIFRHAAIGIELIDLEGNILFVNDHLANMLGYSKNEIRKLHVNDIIHPDDRQSHDSFFTSLVNGQTDDFRMEKRYIRKDRTELWGDASLTPIRDILGNITNIIGVILDVTEKKKATHDLLERERELRLAVSIRDKLFQIIAHDLRGPVGTAKSIVEFICQNPDHYSPSEVSETLHEINLTLQNTYFLLENLLYWSRIQRKQVVYQPAHYDLSLVIAEAIESMQSELNHKKIAIDNQYNYGIVAWCDINLMISVIRNLISNAIKFSPAGQKILIKTYTDNNEAVIDITDYGTGLDMEAIETLKKNRSLPSKHGTMGEKGAGLGFAVLTELIDAQKAKWEIHSTPGSGTSFIIRTPMHP